MTTETPPVSYSPKTVTIAHLIFWQHVERPSSVSSQETVLVEVVHYRGDEVVVEREEDYLRGMKHGAFVTEAQKRAARKAVIEVEEIDITEATDTDLITWLRDDKPTVGEVVTSATGDPDLAARLLVAEGVVTNNDPRKGVVVGLSAIIQGSTTDEE